MKKQITFREIKAICRYVMPYSGSALSPKTYYCDGKKGEIVLELCAEKNCPIWKKLPEK